jgi:hypothetical protein
MIKRKDMAFNADVQKNFLKDENLRQLIRIDELKMRKYHFKLAETPKDFFEALKLVQEVYTQEGYVNAEESSSPCRILRNHFYKKTAIFVGKKKGYTGIHRQPVSGHAIRASNGQHLRRRTKSLKRQGAKHRRSRLPGNPS